MKTLILAALAAALISPPVLAQPLQFQAADGVNNTPVSSANPLPVATGTGTASQQAQGAGAHDSPVAGNPLRVGCRAATSNYTSVTNGDSADCIATLYGAQIVRANAIPELSWQFAAAAPVTGTSDLAVKNAGGSGVRNYVTGCHYQNTSATATEVVLKDGATVIWRGYAVAAMPGGADLSFATPLRGSANTAVNLAALTTGANIYVNCQGFTAP